MGLGKGEWERGLQPGSAPAEGYVTHTGRGGQFCPHFSFNGGSSFCPTRQPVLLLCGVGWERKCHCHRSPRQKTTESCCTMGTTITLQWSSTRAMCVSVTTRAATPAPPSTGSASSCPPAALKGWWRGRAGESLLPQRGLLGQEQVVIRIPRDLGCPSGNGIQTAECSPTLGLRIWGLSCGPKLPHPTTTSPGAP